VEERNFVDQLVDDKLRNLRITPVGCATTIPSCAREHRYHGHLRRDDVKQFAADQDAQKRAKKIDELLQRKEFVISGR